MRIRSILFLGCLIWLAVSSCKKKDEPVGALTSFDYVPTNSGHWVVYDVDSIVHLDNDNNTDDSVRYYHFQIKELISGTFTDGEGRPAQRIERYHRPDTLSDWQITNVWTSTLTSNKEEREEDNVRYISLAFPINGSITWDGNAYNTLGEEDYSYDSFNEPLSLNFIDFDSTLSVLHVLDDNFVEKTYSEEKYAVHVGRVYKIYQDLLKNAGQPVAGLDYEETINSYGN